MQTSPRPSLKKTLRQIALVAGGAFVFAFALVPLYTIACEKIFGIKLETGPAGESVVQDAVIDPNRTVVVEFDGTVNSKLPWKFSPGVLSMEVVPGKLYETHYLAENVAAYPTVGNAAPSVSPATTSQYFNKTECFCFTQQTMQPGEKREMPVRFVVNPALPADVKTITLSYTFFINDSATTELKQSGALAAVARTAY